ncbi:MAG: MMPL family transporter [Spongiibacteraceae bacterium]
MKRTGDRLSLIVWAVLVTAAIFIIANTRFVADLSAFMPKAPTERQQMLLDQLRDGTIGRLVLLGIEGGDEHQRARLSRGLAERLSQSETFSAVQNGDAQRMEQDQRYLFENRYLLSPAITPERFSAAGLHAAIQSTLQEMASGAGLLIKSLLARDPSGETLELLEQFVSESQPRAIDGVWASRDGTRAVLMVEIRASGLNTDAMALALDEIKNNFAQLPQYTAATKLVMTGTSVMSVTSRATIESEVTRLAIISTILVVSLLLLIYRSMYLLLLGLIPVITGALVGIACVSLAFGQVHGLTLGFGTTLIGEAVDYSIYFFVQRGDSNRRPDFWRTIRLGVLTSITGFAALLFSDFPGLSQLGLFTIAGLIAAALAARFVLPPLVPGTIKLRNLDTAASALATLMDRSTRLRAIALVAVALAIGVLYVHRDAIWDKRLTALSPISQAQFALDGSLRADLGDANVRYVASFIAPDQEVALQISERASIVLQQLVDDNVIGSFHAPSRLLPSIATQHARQAALPAEKALQENLDSALQGLPLNADKLHDFVADVAAARARAPLTQDALRGTSLGILLGSMLIQRDKDVLVLMPLRSANQYAEEDRIDIDRVSAALQQQQSLQNHLPHVTVIDLLEETTNIFDDYMRQILLLSGLGCIAIAALLFIACKAKQAWRIYLPVACAVVSVTALLLLFGVQLMLLHLVGLLLVVAVGSNYAMFFATGRQRGNSREHTQEQQQIDLSVVIANLATVTSFGLLGTSSVPVLSAIGTTVAAGTFLALIFSSILSRPASPANESPVDESHADPV